MKLNKIIQGDCLEVLKTFPDEFVDCIITSPPYWGLRDYGVYGQLGLEKTPEEYVSKLVDIFREVKRVLKKEGTLWLNLGDSYAGNCSQSSNNGRAGFGNPTEKIIKRLPNKAKDRSTDKWSYSSCQASGNLKVKDLCGIPWRVAFALQADGWYLRQDIIWHKPNPMPESVQGSHFYRHRVTIEKYEELQRVWKTKSSNQDGASNLPNLSAGKISDSEITLHEKPEGDSDSESKGAEARSKRKTKQVLGNTTSEVEPREISGDSEGNGERTEAGGELQGTASESGGNRNSTGLDGHSGPPPLSLFLLQPEKFQNDSRPQNPIEQRREKLTREHSTSLPQVQLHKEGQNRMDASEEIDCPGCYMCENQNGFIFTLSAGRCTKSHEYIFLLAKSQKYYFDNGAIKEPETSIHKGDSVGGKKYIEANMQGGTGYFSKGTRNKRSVWTVNTKPFKEAHFATFPEELIVPMVKVGSPVGGLVLDPFSGAGTTALVAQKLNRNYLGIELNPEYIEIAKNRLRQEPML